MTDNKIIKGLECCQDKNGYTCDDCPYQEIKHFDEEKGFEIMPNGMTYDTLSCDMWLQEDIFDLINRLQAEKSNLEIELKAMRGAANSYKAENERLKPFEDKIAEFNSHIRVENMLVFANSLEEWLEFCDNLKAEAYKEFAEDLTKKARKKEFKAIYEYDIYNLLKEKVGEDK